MASPYVYVQQIYATDISATVTYQTEIPTTSPTSTIPASSGPYDAGTHVVVQRVNTLNLQIFPPVSVVVDLPTDPFVLEGAQCWVITENAMYYANSDGGSWAPASGSGGGSGTKAFEITVGNALRGDTADMCDILDPGDGSGIAAACNQAAVTGSGTIKLRAGTYNLDIWATPTLPIVVPAEVTLLGDGKNSTLILSTSGAGQPASMFSFSDSSTARNLGIIALTTTAVNDGYVECSGNDVLFDDCLFQFYSPTGTYATDTMIYTERAVEVRNSVVVCNQNVANPHVIFLKGSTQTGTSAKAMIRSTEAHGQAMSFLRLETPLELSTLSDCVFTDVTLVDAYIQVEVTPDTGVIYHYPVLDQCTFSLHASVSDGSIMYLDPGTSVGSTYYFGPHVSDVVVTHADPFLSTTATLATILVGQAQLLSGPYVSNVKMMNANGIRVFSLDSASVQESTFTGVMSVIQTDRFAVEILAIGNSSVNAFSISQCSRVNLETQDTAQIVSGSLSQANFATITGSGVDNNKILMVIDLTNVGSGAGNDIAHCS